MISQSCTNDKWRTPKFGMIVPIDDAEYIDNLVQLPNKESLSVEGRGRSASERIEAPSSSVKNSSLMRRFNYILVSGEWNVAYDGRQIVGYVIDNAVCYDTNSEGVRCR